MPAKPHKNNFKHFIWWGAVLFPAMIIVNTILFRFVFAPGELFFFTLAAAIVVSWILILTLYYVWAIYFYNINRGWTDQDWDEEEKRIVIEGSTAAPEYNPNSEETLGLPPGTVRGTIALSVLVGGMAMLVASLAMPGRLAQNEFLVDNFEYIKTAFLMVIAFYFGSKSLEFINRKQVVGAPGTAPGEGQTYTAASGTPATNPAAQQVSTPGNAPVAINGDISQSVNKTMAASFEDPAAQG